MTDQTTAPAVDAARQHHDRVWNQLAADSAQFATEHPGAQWLAKLTWEAMVVGFARGARYGADRPNDRPTDAQIVAEVMKYVGDAGDNAPAALRELAYADMRARANAGRPAPADKPGGGDCDG